jgi:hypothetical protein
MTPAPVRPLASIQAYPLAWPVGWRRTAVRRKSPYKLALEHALRGLTQELRLFRAKDFVVSTNVRPQLAGLPRDAAEPNDPGVAVYWEDLEGRPRVMGCDSWASVRGNVRAITITIGALRQIERSGASQLLERAFTGFAALPATAASSTWRAVLEVGDGPCTRAEVEAAFRRRAKDVHLKRGGDHEELILVNRARDEALHELRSQT